MHYKNGREARNGDKVVYLSSYGGPVVGILYDAVVGNDACNGRLAIITPTDPTPNLAECLHADDALMVLNGVTGPIPTVVPPVVNTQGEPVPGPTAGTNPVPGPHPTVEPPNAA